MAEANTSVSPDLKANTVFLKETTSAAVFNSLPANHGIPGSTTVVLDAGSALAMTLVAPTAGTDDGKEITFIDPSGHAHTVTTPANTINGSNDTGTFSGTKGVSWTLRAYNGTWWAQATTGVTLSEV